MKALFPLCVIALFSTGCAIHFGRRQPPDAPPPPPPGQSQRPMTHAGGEVIQVKEIKARYVRARVIYAKEVKAKRGRIGNTYQSNPNGNWGKGELKTDEVIADTIYAKEIKADVIDADEVYAKEVKLGN